MVDGMRVRSILMQMIMDSGMIFVNLKNFLHISRTRLKSPGW